MSHARAASLATSKRQNATRIDLTGESLQRKRARRQQRLDRKRRRRSTRNQATEARDRATSSRNTGRNQIGTVGDIEPE